MMNDLIKSFMVKNHSAAFLMLIGAELEDYDLGLSNDFIYLANRKREYEHELHNILNKIDKSDVIFKEILQKAYYDYDEYVSNEYSANKEEIKYLIDILEMEEAKLFKKEEALRLFNSKNGRI